ncbi:MAG: pyridoxamine 5'-phosphate oxidase family protein [Acidobacteria bacterium]|nr:pyridoxamine 5'-phosphate oxidase family protein [Acidobacteriota bacterium]
MPRLPTKMKQFCDEQKLLRLAYVDGDGYPHVMPVWFVRMGDDFAIGTQNSSAKWQSMQRNPKVAWVIDAGTSTRNYRGVSFSGTAEQITDKRLHRRAFSALGMKYYGSTEHREFLQLFADPSSILIRLRPERFFFWDHTS